MRFLHVNIQTQLQNNRKMKADKSNWRNPAPQNLMKTQVGMAFEPQADVSNKTATTPLKLATQMGTSWALLRRVAAVGARHSARQRRGEGAPCGVPVEPPRELLRYCDSQNCRHNFHLDLCNCAWGRILIVLIN